MENKSKKLSYESDGQMGIQKEKKHKKNQKDEKELFFNSTQNSEWIVGTKDSLNDKNSTSCQLANF